MDTAIQVLQTKITLPHRRIGILSRGRLNDLFNELLDHKLIVVTAPAGYGKTSLLVDIAHQHELPFCWLSLDSLDQDLQRFATHFIASIERCFPGFGEHSKAATQAIDGGNSSIDRLVTTIANDVYQFIREHFVIVLDDYHLVDESEQINAFVNRFIQCIDENCHLVILSRSLLPLSDLPLLVARSQVGGIGFRELSFRADEIQALMLQNYNQAIPKATAEELVQKTEGWITGLLLSAQTMWQGMVDRLRVIQASGVDLYDYLINQVLNQQTPELRDFLLRTSLLEEFDADLCASVLGAPPPGYSWSEMLSDVLKHNLFVLPIGEDETWLRYHHLFQAFLQSRVVDEQPEEATRIRHSLMSVYTRRGEWEKAYAVCQQLEDVNATAALIEAAGEPLVVGCRTALLLKWLDALPVDTLNTHPALLARRGIALALHGDTQQGLSLLDRAVMAFRTLDNRPRLTGTLVWRALAHFLQANYPLSLTDTDEALSLAEGDEELSRFWAEAYRIRGMSFRLLGKLTEAIDSLSRSLASFQTLMDAQGVNRLRLELGAAYTNAGDFVSALSYYKQAADYYRDQNERYALSSVLNDLAFLYYLRGDFPLASKTFDEALANARESGNAHAEALVLIGLGDLYADIDMYQAALDIYVQARDVVRQINDRFLMIYLGLAEAAVDRSDGDLDHAHQLLETTLQLVEQDRSDYVRGLYLLEVGRLTLAAKDHSQATPALAEAAGIFKTGGQQVEEGRAYLMLAMAHFANKNMDAAIESLSAAFRLTYGGKNHNILVVPGRQTKALLEQVQDSLLVGQQAVYLLKQINRFEKAIPTLHRRLQRYKSAVPPTLPRLQIRALGAALVAVDGKPITSADWQTQTARNLFFLVLSKTEGWIKDVLGEILWPDSSPAQLKLRFKNTIYRLRRALGEDVVVFDGTRYAFNWTLGYEYDVENFWEAIAQAEDAANVNDQKSAYQAAIQIYQGEYLPEVGEIWVLPERERLRQAYVDASLKLASLYLEDFQYELVLDICQRLILQDPCLEDAYRTAMHAYAMIGNTAAVARQYEMLQEALLSEIGASPSPQTEALFQSLMRHKIRS
jgi:LuxR family maltose regulon positive regulatory protein